MKLTNEQKELIKYGMPDGWWKRFGEAFVEDLEEVLTKHNISEDEFQIYDVKEKFGQLRFYSNAPDEWEDHMYAWEYISERTCIVCGKFPVFTETTGWICPMCEECAKENKMGKLREKFMNKLSSIVVYNVYTKDGRYEEGIDLLPYYKKMGYEYEK